MKARWMWLLLSLPVLLTIIRWLVPDLDQEYVEREMGVMLKRFCTVGAVAGTLLLFPFVIRLGHLGERRSSATDSYLATGIVLDFPATFVFSMEFCVLGWRALVDLLPLIGSVARFIGLGFVTTGALFLAIIGMAGFVMAVLSYGKAYAPLFHAWRRR